MAPMKKSDTSEIDPFALIGKDIRALRKNRKWTLGDLAQKSDCSVGYLSEIERGERSVSIKILRAIAASFDVPLGWFFSHENQPARERGRIVRRQNRKRIGSSEDGLFEELLSPDLGGTFEMFLTKVEPGSVSNGVVYRGVEEEGYIISGQLDLSINDEVYKLSEGDSFRIHNEEFSWANAGQSQTHILWVTSPPVY